MENRAFSVLIAALFLLLPCLASARESAMSGMISRDLQLVHEGVSRSYHLYVPGDANPALRSVVLLLHGHGGSADQIIGEKGRKSPYKMWFPIADRERLILIIPNGLVSSDGKQGWNDARNLPTNPSSDDVAFLHNLIEQVAKSYSIDQQKIYAMGTSNGGHMVLRLAAEAAETYAAVAAVAAANPAHGFSRAPSQPISILLMNGTKDKYVPYDGGMMIAGRGEVQSTEESISYWVGKNDCDQSPMVKRFRDRVRRDRSTVSTKSYANRSTNTEVKLYQIEGGGHTEPSIKQPYRRLFLALVGAQNRDIEMADEVWRFFKDKGSQRG